MNLSKNIGIAIAISLVLIVLRIAFAGIQSELLITLNMAIAVPILYAIWFYVFEKKIISITISSKQLVWLYVASIVILILLIELSRSKGGSRMDVFAIALAILIFHIVFSWFYDKWKTIQELKNEQVKSQLNQLKNQINPHFFFNTLNKLYALIKADPDEAQQYVLKLSEIMRFTIYEGQNETVSLKEEILYLENYIALQSSRYQKQVSITFEKEVDNVNARISPLLSVILIENAFKHGVETVVEQALVNIKMIEKNDLFELHIQNNFEANKEQDSSGIGLENLKKRLAILYPNKHELILNFESDKMYSAILKLNLS